jgi:hypothetical protein
VPVPRPEHVGLRDRLVHSDARRSDNIEDRRGDWHIPNPIDMAANWTTRQIVKWLQDNHPEALKGPHTGEPLPFPHPKMPMVHLAGGGTPEDPLPPGGFDVAPYQWPVGVPTGPEALQAPEGPAVPATPLPPLTLDQLKLRAAGSEPGPLVTTGPFAYPTKATEDDIYGSGQEGAIQAIGVPDWGDMPKIPVKKDKKGRPIKLTKKQQDRQNEITKVATRARGEATEQAAKEQQYARNAVVAAHHSPIAAMGLDTRHLRIIDNMVEQSGNIGEYIPPGGREPHGLLRPDEMGADAAYPSTAIHESVHRGMQLLRDKYPDQFKKIVGKSEMPLVEEYMVRGLEQKVFGNIEMSEETQALDVNIQGYPDDRRTRHFSNQAR